jgi:hypothetical protein
MPACTLTGQQHPQGRGQQAAQRWAVQAGSRQVQESQGQPGGHCISRGQGAVQGMHAQPGQLLPQPEAV